MALLEINEKDILNLVKDEFNEAVNEKFLNKLISLILIEIKNWDNDFIDKPFWDEMYRISSKYLNGYMVN